MTLVSGTGQSALRERKAVPSVPSSRLSHDAVFVYLCPVKQVAGHSRVHLHACLSQ